MQSCKTLNCLEFKHVPLAESINIDIVDTKYMQIITIFFVSFVSCFVKNDKSF